METTTTHQVADTIRNQIGAQALAMLGARHLVADTKSLQFKIGKNAAKITHVRVNLEPTDTYRIEFIRVGRTTTIITEDMAYADELCRIIEVRTGLYTSLGPVVR